MTETTQLINPEHAKDLADRLEIYAKRLREHPEIFDAANFSEDFPVTPVYENPLSHEASGFVRDHPLIFNLQLVLWPQRLPPRDLSTIQVKETPVNQSTKICPHPQDKIVRIDSVSPGGGLRRGTPFCTLCDTSLPGGGVF